MIPLPVLPPVAIHPAATEILPEVEIPEIPVGIPQTMINLPTTTEEINVARLTMPTSMTLVQTCSI